MTFSQTGGWSYDLADLFQREVFCFVSLVLHCCMFNLLLYELNVLCIFSSVSYNLNAVCIISFIAGLLVATMERRLDTKVI